MTWQSQGELMVELLISCLLGHVHSHSPLQPSPYTCPGASKWCLGSLLCTATDGQGTLPGCAAFSGLSVLIAYINKEILACFSLTFLAYAPNFWITNPVENLKEEPRIQACLFQLHTPLWLPVWAVWFTREGCSSLPCAVGTAFSLKAHKKC